MGLVDGQLYKRVGLTMDLFRTTLIVASSWSLLYLLTDKKLAIVTNRVTKGQPTDQTQFVLQDDVTYCRGEKTERRYKEMLPSCLEQKMFKFIHFALGHSGVEKCMVETKYMFHVRNLGRKISKFTAHCDVCRQCKHPNRSFTYIV